MSCSAQRFCDDDMRKNQGLKRNKRILEIATRFSGCRGDPPLTRCCRADRLALPLFSTWNLFT
ncbi:hypothetical protein ASD02_30695 [Ensifer sp. Root1252]|nr:hypothetical protein ASD02_30695 [Ensifer sp. Root1252]KRC77356.1 hypothetical protein ASE32_30090 [Ensifer sp. Root231]KRC99262.1 hypothetical protein ASE47_28085 [Ensifer sp. Root258]